MNEKEFNEISKLHYLSGTDKWYSWDSPIGLGLFLVSLALVIILLHFAWIMK